MGKETQEFYRCTSQKKIFIYNYLSWREKKEKVIPLLTYNTSIEYDTE